MAGHFDLPCVAGARLGPGYPTAKCEIGLMSSSFFIFYIFHQFNYISATKLWRLIAYSSFTRKHFFLKGAMKYPCGGGERAAPATVQKQRALSPESLLLPAWERASGSAGSVLHPAPSLRAGHRGSRHTECWAWL